MKILIDTNIAIDLMQQREGFFEDAQTVFLFACTEHVEAFFSATTMTTLYYILHQCFHDNKYVKEVLKSWKFAIQIMPILSEDCGYALDSLVSDYEDAVLDEAAFRSGFDYIVTRNIKDFNHSKVKAITPSEFIKVFMSKDFNA